MQTELIPLFYSQYGVDVLGIDLSDEMICKAKEYRENLGENTRNKYVFLILISKSVFFSIHNDLMYKY